MNTEPKPARGRGFNAYRIDGDVAILVLTNHQGAPVYEAKVDAADLPKLQEFGRRWAVLRPAAEGYPYAELRLSGPGTRSLRLHRFLLDAPADRYVDHINGDTLDNRRENLRLVTNTQNSQNRRASKRSRSGLKNICWDEGRQRWRVYLCANGKRMSIGYFRDLEDAKKAASAARRRYHTHAPDHELYAHSERPAGLVDALGAAL